jgi:hypothetical protein
MEKSEIQPKTEYALRERRVAGAPFQRVRVIEHVRRNKWKVQWIEPNPGLVDYVESGQLMAPWKDHKAFLKEEGSAQHLREHNERHGYEGEDTPIVNALYEVFETVGERDVSFYKGSLKGPPDAIARVRARAGISVERELLPAYVDRRGILHVPFDSALELARKFSAAEPTTVLVAVEATEREWAQKARHGEDYIVKLLNEYQAAWALIRQWAGHDAAIAQREAQIQRLERLA